MSDQDANFQGSPLPARVIRTVLAACFCLPLSLAQAYAAEADAPQENADADRSQDAGESEDEDKAELENVTVTARHTEEFLQDVPIAETVFSSQDLERLQADDLTGIEESVPNMNLVQGRGSASSANIFIRGIGQPDALQTFDPGVGVYVNGVYLSRIQGALLDLHDVESIEVLRGPQGTLYGKNTIGGAIKVNTRVPDGMQTNSVEAKVGDYGRYAAEFYLSGEVSDDLYYSVSGLTKDMDGYVENPDTGRQFNDNAADSARLILRSVPTANLDITFQADYTQEDNALSMGRLESNLVQVDLVTGPRVLEPAPPQGEEFDYTARTSFGPDQGQELEHSGMSVNVDWSLDEKWNLTSITGRRELDTDFYIDIDATRFEVGDVFVGIDQEQTSQEFRLAYDTGGFRGVFGLYYLKEEVASDQRAFADDLLAVGGFPVDFLRTIRDDLETTSKAAFMHGDWEFTPAWSLSAGVRWSRDEKEYFRTTSTFSDVLPALEGTFAFSDEDSWSEVTPSAALQYTANSTLMYYGSVSKGFKSGGFNGRANSPSDTSSFEPETVLTYEIGSKSQWLDRRLTLNWALFQSDYENFQARVAEDLNSFPVLNAAELDIRGAELEAMWSISDATSLQATLGYLDAEYDEFFDARQPDNDRSDDVVPFTPDITARLGGTHGISLANGSLLTLGGGVSYRDEQYLSVDNQEALTQDAYSVVNAFLAYETPQRDWRFTLGGRNLTDEVYKVDAQEFSNVGNIQTAYYGPPRHWYLSAQYRF